MCALPVQLAYAVRCHLLGQVLASGFTVMRRLRVTTGFCCQSGSRAKLSIKHSCIHSSCSYRELVHLCRRGVLRYCWAEDPACLCRYRSACVCCAWTETERLARALRWVEAASCELRRFAGCGKVQFVETRRSAEKACTNTLSSQAERERKPQREKEGEREREREIKIERDRKRERERDKEQDQRAKSNKRSEKRRGAGSEKREQIKVQSKRRTVKGFVSQ